MGTQTKTPIAVAINDIHYNLNTLLLADAALKQAVAKANSLNVKLIILGDLHDTKANLRGECVNAMIETIKGCHQPPIIIVGNHDRINEKAEAHSLNFLEPYATIVPKYSMYNNLYLIAYHHDLEELKTHLKTIPKGSTILMHQGITGADSGDYFLDKSAIPRSALEGHTVYSGHYHARSDIYLGNPYTLTYGEARDPEKGFHILYSDSSVEFIPTNLRKHRVYALRTGEPKFQVQYNPGDLVWIKVFDTYEHLEAVTRANIAQELGLPQTGWKLDLIPTDTEIELVTNLALSQDQALDSIIDTLEASSELKLRLKTMWRNMVSE